MILEGLATTRNRDGGWNISAMGPLCDREMRSLVLRPFPGSVTYNNLSRERQGVWHVTDDSRLLVRAALNLWDGSQPELCETSPGGCWRLADCCRWYAFRVERVDESGERPRFEAVVTDSGRVRDFVGWNRARHAVIEAAILASRIPQLGREHVLEEIARLESAVTKTGDEAEFEAFALVQRYAASRPQ